MPAKPSPPSLWKPTKIHISKALALLLSHLLAVRSAGPLQAVLQEHVHKFNNSELLKEGLLFTIKTSAELLQERARAANLASELGHIQLDPHGDEGEVEPVLQAAVAAFGTVERLAQLDPVLGVLARRLITARIALLWLTPSKVMLTSDVEQALSDVTRKLYDIHVQSVVRRGLIQHLHISKSGGTSFSSAAGDSKCAQLGMAGQPTHLGDQARWMNATAFTAYTGYKRGSWTRWGVVRRESELQTCEDRARDVASRGLHYISNEYTLLGGLTDMAATHVCTQFVNVVTLRDPERRLVSNVHFAIMVLSLWFRRQDPPAPPRLVKDLFCSDNLTVWRDIAPPVLDNYVTRSFLGEAGFHTPPGQLGPEHVSLARRLLLQFDLVADLDAGPEAARLLLRQGLGWNVTLADVKARHGPAVARRHDFDVDAEGCRNDLLLGEVLPRQEPDRRLYSTGRVVSFLDGLLLSLAHRLGLRPHPNTTSDAAADTAADNRRYPCGLLGLAPRGGPGEGRERRDGGSQGGDGGSRDGDEDDNAGGGHSRSEEESAEEGEE